MSWLRDVWEGFSTVLVGMNITWRHLFVKKVTLHYPEEKWQLPPRSRMRLFMKYEDCIGCGQCARACPVDCIYMTPEYEFASTDLTNHLYHFAKPNAKFLTVNPKPPAKPAAAAQPGAANNPEPKLPPQPPKAGPLPEPTADPEPSKA